MSSAGDATASRQSEASRERTGGVVAPSCCCSNLRSSRLRWSSIERSLWGTGHQPRPMTKRWGRQRTRDPTSAEPPRRRASRHRSRRLPTSRPGWTEVGLADAGRPEWAARRPHKRTLFHLRTPSQLPARKLTPQGCRRTEYTSSARVLRCAVAPLLSSGEDSAQRSGSEIGRAHV